MKGMPHFMCKGKHIIKSILIIQQYIWMCSICTPGIRTASFSFIFVNINPSVFKSLFQMGYIVRAHRCKSFQHHFFCLFIRNLLVHIFCHRCIDIIHMQFFHTQHFFSQSHIFIHCRQGFMNSCNQILIDRYRNGIFH